MLRPFLLVVLCLGLSGCTGVPEGVEPVTGLDAERYLGRWYEIARLDHSFERGLEGVNANYSLRDDGAIRVVNRGFNSDAGEWDEAVGVAKFVQDASVGHLKVSFFGPFYGSYVVFELDQEGYEYAFVTGFNRSWLWLLARKPVVDEALRERFVQRVGELGFATDELIWVDQSRNL